VDDDRDSFLAAGVTMDRFLDATLATCDYARAVGRHRKRINLCFDEWNVWYQRQFAGEDNLEVAPTAPPLIEDTYSALDAVVVGSLLISLLRHADRVRIACLAQLVNVIAPIRTEPGGPAWRQPTFYPFALTSRHGRGTVLRVEPRSPVHETRALGEVPLLDAIAVLDEEAGTLALFAVNRDQRQPIALEADIRALPDLAVGEQVTLFDEDPDAVNSATAPDRVTPGRQDDIKVGDGRMEAVLPPLSWSMILLGSQGR
jgi:alpha-L-arabinofuranosidase